NFVSGTGTISIMPSAYGRSACCCGVSGAGSGSMRCARITLLVLNSPFQKSGTLTGCLRTDIFGAGAFFGALSGVGSFTTTNTSYEPAPTVNDRDTRCDVWPAVMGTKLMSSYA